MRKVIWLCDKCEKECSQSKLIELDLEITQNSEKTNKSIELCSECYEKEELGIQKLFRTKKKGF